MVAEFLADAARQHQAGVLGLHHHVEQHQRDVGGVAQRLEPLGGAVSRKQFELAALEADVAQRQPGDRVDVGVVVDHQYPPRPLRSSGAPFAEADAVICFCFGVGVGVGIVVDQPVVVVLLVVILIIQLVRVVHAASATAPQQT